MERIIGDDAVAAAHAAARHIATALRAALAARERASLAVSGGTSPWIMLAELGNDELDWSRVDILQVDERMATDGDDLRNLTHLTQSLAGTRAMAARVHAMPCGHGDADAAAAAYVPVVEALGGPIDVVHLGLGDDGHTASLAPGDPVLDVTDTAVAATAHPFNGTRRVTLTYPTINAARAIVWLLTGAGKVPMVSRLEAADPSIPAGRVEQARAVLVMDRAAAGGV
jgi:6-phosphogluconolactonase